MITKMLYRQYKKHYSDCKTIQGTYDPDTRTISVDIPDGRIKPSGVRGEKYSYYSMYAVHVSDSGRVVRLTYKAITINNAWSRFVDDCKRSKGNLIPIGSDPSANFAQGHQQPTPDLYGKSARRGA